MIYYLKSRHSCSEVLCLSSETVAQEDLLSYSSRMNLDSCLYARNSMDAVIENQLYLRSNRLTKTWILLL